MILTYIEGFQSTIRGVVKSKNQPSYDKNIKDILEKNKSLPIKQGNLMFVEKQLIVHPNIVAHIEKTAITQTSAGIKIERKTQDNKIINLKNLIVIKIQTLI